MKDIRIFVASSKELEKERNCLAFLVLAHEDEFAKRGLRVRLGSPTTALKCRSCMTDWRNF